MKQKADCKKLIELISGDKKKVVIIAVAVLGIILIVFSSVFQASDKAEETTDTVSTPTFDEGAYTLRLEAKLEDMISSVYGAGKTKVIVTLDCDYETVYARDGSYSQDSDSSNEKNEYIIIGSEEKEGGLLLKTVTPRVRGVAVVCEGGNLPQVENAVSELLSAVLDVGTNHISVSKINK